MALPSVLVCGGGIAAQAVSCIFSSRYKVAALSLVEDEAQRWTEAIEKAGGMFCGFQGCEKLVVSKPDLITKDPSVAKFFDIVLFTVTSAEHEQYFKALEPHVKDGTIFAVMPARSGCDFLFRKVMDIKADKLGLAAFETLPWALKCREWGKSSTMLGIKETVEVAVLPPRGKTTGEVILNLQGLLGIQPMIVECPNVMSLSLSNPGQVLHPGVVFGRWKNWDGNVLMEKPLFYHGVDKFTADVLNSLSAEITRICKAFKAVDRNFDTSQVKTVFQWYMSTYSESVEDSTTLQSAMNTNKAYEGLNHPMKEANGGYVPDFQFRYLSEDIPTGLCFTKGVADLLGVKTPTIDKVVKWCQDKLGKEFLTPDNKMAGKDLKETRAPQAYGITTKKALLSHMKITPSRRPCIICR